MKEVTEQQKRKEKQRKFTKIQTRFQLTEGGEE
jgi:hypothetical protein